MKEHQRDQPRVFLTKKLCAQAPHCLGHALCIATSIHSSVPTKRGCDELDHKEFAPSWSISVGPPAMGHPLCYLTPLCCFVRICWSHRNAFDVAVLCCALVCCAILPVEPGDAGALGQLHQMAHRRRDTRPAFFVVPHRPVFCRATLSVKTTGGPITAVELCPAGYFSTSVWAFNLVPGTGWTKLFQPQDLHTIYSVCEQNVPICAPESTQMMRNTLMALVSSGVQFL